MRTPDIVVITGTDTGVGKTVVTAAVATALGLVGDRPVSVHKLVQTGVSGEGYGDAAQATTLTWAAPDVTCTEGIRLTDPMAPVPAAEREGRRLLNVSEHAGHLVHLADSGFVVAEGSGGVLVELDRKGGTLADLAGAAQYIRPDVEVAYVVVCRADLGTLNHTALTLEALAARGTNVMGLVIGSWPADPDFVHRSNVTELQKLAPILGAIPEGQGELDSQLFVERTPSWLPGFMTLASEFCAADAAPTVDDTTVDSPAATTLDAPAETAPATAEKQPATTPDAAEATPPADAATPSTAPDADQPVESAQSAEPDESAESGGSAESAQPSGSGQAEGDTTAESDQAATDDQAAKGDRADSSSTITALPQMTAKPAAS